MSKSKRTVSFILCLCILISLVGCKKKSEEYPEIRLPETFMPEDLALSEDDVVYEDNVPYVASQVLLTVKSDTPYETVEKMIHKEAGEIIGFISFSGDYHVDFPDGKNYNELNYLVEKWSQAEFVEAVSLNRVFLLSSNSIDYKNDPWIDTTDSKTKQDIAWNEENPDGNNWWAEAIRMPTVWDMDIWESNSISGIKLGLIDSAFDTTNQDFAGVFMETWQNGDSIPPETRFHGTHVAGLMAAQIGNGRAIAGAASCAHPALYGFALRGEESEIYCGMMAYKYAIALMLEHDVRIINISQSIINSIIFAAQQGNQEARELIAKIDKELELFLKKAIDVGYDFLIVKSAGNTSDVAFVSCPISEKSPYGYREARKADGEKGSSSICSAKYGMFTGISDPDVGTHIITVGAAAQNGWSEFLGGTGYTRAAFSNVDCDVYAPGVDILSTIPGAVAAGKDSGTSMAAPIVSGVAGLVWSVNPNLSSKQVKDILIVSASYKALEGGTDFVEDEVTIIDAAFAIKLAIALNGDSDSAEETNGVLMGTVYTETTNCNGEKQIESIPNAQIVVRTENNGEVVKEICSDENGGFDLFLPEGKYQFSCEDEDKKYERYERIITVTDGSVEYLSIRLGIDIPDAPVDTQAPVTEGFVGNQTVEQLRKSIVGSWGEEGCIVSDYDFYSDGTCYWSFDKQTEGTYKIRDDKMLLITFPWMSDRYFWTEETYEEWCSHSSENCWYMTDSGVLLLNGVNYYRDGKVIKEYNTEGGLLATIAGAWILNNFIEYRFFMDGTYEENMVSVSSGVLLSRVNIKTGPIEIIDDRNAKLWKEAESFGDIPYYLELAYDPETDTLCIGGSSDVCYRAEYLN